MTGTAIDEARRHVTDLGATAMTAWPTTDGGLTARLELPGGPCAAQYLPSAAAAAHESARTPGTSVHGRWVLHPGGVDRRLPSLADRLTAPGTRLMGHRIGRRAVLRLESGAFRKVVRASRLPALVTATRAAAALPLRTPQLLDHDHDSVTLAAVPGVSLHDLLAARPAADLAGELRRVGETVAALHRITPPTGAPTHDVTAELAVLAHWQTVAAAWGLPADDTPLPPAPPTRTPVPLHRDLHDKQLIIDETGVGLIDFDLAALGDPALDLANLVVHLRWREAQGRCRDSDRLVAALLDGYRPDAAVLAALPFYAEVARRRLQAVYHFRTPTGSADVQRPE